MVLNMRLYHRRSSSVKNRSGDPQLCNMTAAVNPRQQSLQALGARGHRNSLGCLRTVPPPPRPRSLSLFPGSEASHCLPGPQTVVRSRSLSGDLGLRPSAAPVQPVLTASEEDHIFRCYVRLMYMVLGMLGVAILGLVLYALQTSVVAPKF